MKPKILVLGGAGYIGSHLVRILISEGYSPVVIDDLSGGFASAVTDAELIVGSISDKKFLRTIFSFHTFSAVMHLASFISVGESVNHPGKYYSNNLISSIGLLDVMREFQVDKIIFSSTAAVYGNPLYTPIDEKHPTQPINPYGRTKLMVEEVLKDYEIAYGLRSVCLRYFNAAGADPEGILGERHDPETHLIPLILQSLSGRRDLFDLYGDNYSTPDGTCIRDYVHVMDLCTAHLLSLNKLLSGGNSATYNLGYGKGYSVREVIESAQKITGQKLKYSIKPKREGDSPELVANAILCRDELGWSPKYDSLDTIISHAWDWEQKYPWNSLEF
jgi:UDP-glucose 4-epimerase